MTQKKEIPPALRKRQAWSEMLRPTRRLAKDFDVRLCADNRQQMLVEYDMGAHIQEMLADVDVYGTNAAEQLAEWLYMDVGKLYEARNVAVRFGRDAVGKQAEIPCEGGLLLQFGHFVQLARLPTLEMAVKVCAQIRVEDLTVRDTAKLVDSILGNSV